MEGVNIYWIAAGTFCVSAIICGVIVFLIEYRKNFPRK
jgi:hypothetical protein